MKREDGDHNNDGHHRKDGTSHHRTTAASQIKHENNAKKVGAGETDTPKNHRKSMPQPTRQRRLSNRQRRNTESANPPASAADQAGAAFAAQRKRRDSRAVRERQPDPIAAFASGSGGGRVTLLRAQAGATLAAQQASGVSAGQYATNEPVVTAGFAGTSGGASATLSQRESEPDPLDALASGSGGGRATLLRAQAGAPVAAQQATGVTAGQYATLEPVGLAPFARPSGGLRSEERMRVSVSSAPTFDIMNGLIQMENEYGRDVQIE